MINIQFFSNVIATNMSILFHFLKDSTDFICDRAPERTLSFSLKIPELKRLNHICATLINTVVGLYTA